jgi:hypothetical protein
MMLAMRFSKTILILPLLAACSGGGFDQYEATTRQLSNGHYAITVKGTVGAKLDELSEQSDRIAKRKCDGAFLPRGSKVTSYYGRPVGTFDRYPRADRFDFTAEVECFRAEDSEES